MQEYFYQLNIIEQISLIVLSLSLLTTLYFYLIIYLKVRLWKPKTINSNQPPVSVIICAKNESENLENFLPIICSQNYPLYEVIVVNDSSVDDTETVLGILCTKYKNLRYTNLVADRKFIHGKKLAVTIGLKSAKNDIVLLTDADCCPVSDNWIQQFVNQYNNNTSFVLGYGGYNNQKGLLNKFIRFDTVFIAMQYLGFAIGKQPYMGVGRNLSYKKQVYFNGTGFRNHYNINSGDDDLFINEHANKKNTSVVITPDSFTRSIPCQTFAQWSKQKQRHLSTAVYYKFWHRVKLMLEPLSRLFFYLSLISLFVISSQPLIPLAAYLFRLIVIIIITKLCMNKLSEKGFLALIPIFDVLMPILNLFFIISNKFNTRNTKWK